jgi:ubiquinone/menaquinone biosynthesis C-methylase UbiE
MVSIRDGKKNRSELVISQYDTSSAAHNYAQSHADTRADGRHLQMRVGLILDLLEDVPGNQVLDAGCGPGVLARALLRSARHDVSLTVLDQSAAMIRYCLDSTEKDDKLRASVGDLEALPLAESSFDVAIATGVLEYLNVTSAIGELSRVTRPGGIVILSMLNPINPYRLGQWYLYWPAVRAAGFIERLLRVPRERRHGASLTGIRALRSTLIRKRLRRAGFVDDQVIFFDRTILIPPFDRHAALDRIDKRAANAITSRRLAPWLSKGYLVIAQRG